MNDKYIQCPECGEHYLDDAVIYTRQSESDEWEIDCCQYCDEKAKEHFRCNFDTLPA